MKKLLVLLMVLVSLSSYGQNIGISVSPKLNVNLDYRFYTTKLGGVGIDLYRDRVVYSDNFFIEKNNPLSPYTQKDIEVLRNTNKRSSIGVYYITPKYKGFDFMVGIGVLNYSIVENGVRNTYSHTGYTIYGINKDINLTKKIDLQLRGVIRNMSKYGQSKHGRMNVIEPMVGIKYEL
jgi:hypothetical protein